MSWESDPVEKDTSRDYGRYLWPGVVLVVSSMIAAMWWIGHESSVGQTRARFQAIQISFDRRDSASQDEALKTIAQLRQRIVDGESFSKLANQYSDYENTSGRGGNWGWMIKIENDLVPAMGAFVWYGPVNELSPIIRGAKAYHLILIQERELSEIDQYEIDLKRRSRNKATNELSP